MVGFRRCTTREMRRRVVHSSRSAQVRWPRYAEYRYTSLAWYNAAVSQRRYFVIVVVEQYRRKSPRRASLANTSPELVCKSTADSWVRVMQMLAHFCELERHPVERIPPPRQIVFSGGTGSAPAPEMLTSKIFSIISSYLCYCGCQYCYHIKQKCCIFFPPKAFCELWHSKGAERRLRPGSASDPAEELTTLPDRSL